MNTVDLGREALNTDTEMDSTQTIDDMSALLMGMCLTKTITKINEYTVKTETVSMDTFKVIALQGGTLPPMSRPLDKHAVLVLL